jgi:hypothetical protein
LGTAAVYLFFVFFPKKSMSKKAIWALPFFLLCWVSCGTRDNAREKNDRSDTGNEYMSVAILEARYDADAGSVMARAALWRGSDPVLLPNGLFFNEKPAPLVEVPGKPAHYLYEGKAKTAPDRFAFTFMAPDQSQYAFEGAMPLLDSLRISPVVSLSRPLRLSWDGPPLAEDEALHVMVSDAARAVKQVILDGPTQTASVTFPSDQFSGLAPGKGEVTLLRQAIREENVRGIRVKSTLSYYARRANVLLEK